MTKVDACLGSAGAATSDNNRRDRRNGACKGDGAGGHVVVIDSDAYNQRHADCHRDVRTHRVNGVLLKHRHVGDNCAIRVVTTSGTGE